MSQRVIPGGFEPPTFGLGTRCSVRLSYGISRRIEGNTLFGARQRDPDIGNRQSKPPPGGESFGNEPAETLTSQTYRGAPEDAMP